MNQTAEWARTILNIHGQLRTGAAVSLHGGLVEDTPQYRRVLPPAPRPGVVSQVRVPVDEADALISQMVRYFERATRRFTWVVGPDTEPANLGSLLQRRGLVLAAEDVALAAVPADMRLPAPSVGVTVEPVATDEQVGEMALVSAAVYGMEQERLREIYRNQFRKSPDDLRYIVRSNGRAVAIGSARIYGDAMYLLGGETHPEWRGRGHYTALLRARVQEAKRRKVALVCTVASDTSAPILAKFGLQECFREQTHEWPGK